MGTEHGAERGVVLGGSSTATEALETEAADALGMNKLLMSGAS